MTERRLFLDQGPGERRAVLTVDDRPDRLLIERIGQAYPRLGAHYAARVMKIDRGAGLALLDLSAGQQAALRLKPDRAAPVEGAAVEVEIAIEPQGEKAAVVRVVGPAQGAPRLIQPAPALEQRLSAWAPGVDIQGGRSARQVADEAEDQALAIEHALPGGGSIALETTRALTAIDVDLGAAGGQEAKRAARRANLAAIGEAARLLRLKGQGGLVVIDLVGSGHDGQALSQAARTAFASDQPGVVIGPISRFGTMELALPRRFRPLSDVLTHGRGTVSLATLALRLLRAAEREALADPGGRIQAKGSPDVVAEARAGLVHLERTFGPRIELVADTALGREAIEVSRR